MNCQRCQKPSVTHWVYSDLAAWRVCQACADSAAAMSAKYPGRPGKMIIAPLWFGQLRKGMGIIAAGVAIEIILTALYFGVPAWDRARRAAVVSVTSAKLPLFSDGR